MSSEKSKDAEETALRAMKGWKLVRDPGPLRDGVAKATADAVMPSLTQLRTKYLGTAAPSDVSVSRDSTSVSTPPDLQPTETVTVESGGIRKSVGVSQGKVVWRQG